jgi:hypothetical protein
LNLVWPEANDGAPCDANPEQSTHAEKAMLDEVLMVPRDTSSKGKFHDGPSGIASGIAMVRGELVFSAQVGIWKHWDTEGNDLGEEHFDESGRRVS